MQMLWTVVSMHAVGSVLLGAGDDSLFFSAENRLPNDGYCGDPMEKDAEDLYKASETNAHAGACWAFTATWIAHILDPKSFEEITVHLGTTTNQAMINKCREIFKARIPTKKRGWWFPIEAGDWILALDVLVPVKLSYAHLLLENPDAVKCIQRSMFGDDIKHVNHANGLLNDIVHANQRLQELGERNAGAFDFAGAFGENREGPRYDNANPPTPNPAFHYMPWHLIKKEGLGLVETIPAFYNVICLLDGYVDGDAKGPVRCGPYFFSPEGSLKKRYLTTMSDTSEKGDKLKDVPIERLILCGSQAIMEHKDYSHKEKQKKFLPAVFPHWFKNSASYFDTVIKNAPVEMKKNRPNLWKKVQQKFTFKVEAPKLKKSVTGRLYSESQLETRNCYSESLIHEAMVALPNIPGQEQKQDGDGDQKDTATQFGEDTATQSVEDNYVAVSHDTYDQDDDPNFQRVPPPASCMNGAVLPCTEPSTSFVCTFS